VVSAVNVKKVDKPSEAIEAKPSVIQKPIVASAGPKSISIKNALAGKVQSQPKIEEVVPETDDSIVDELEEIDEIEDENSPFTQLELEAQWQNYIQSHLVEKPRYASLMSTYSPAIGSDFKIVVNVESQFQVEMFSEIKMDLLIFLRKKLDNKSIVLEVEIQEQENGKNMMYTSEDKYKYLSQINPSINKLRQELGLEFD
jgi:DNA polymerase-3 subunit gamma/tau